MYSVAPFFLLLAVLVSPSQEHPIAKSTVSSCDFQEKINKTLNKEQCESTPLTECCQMKAVGDILLGIHVKTGIYGIRNPCKLPTTFSGITRARCDMDTDNGGWLVIQRRLKNGTVDFNRGWNDYQNGFGDLEGEFWYGLQDIHCLSHIANMELRIDMEDESGNKITWIYQEFRLHDRGDNYRLHIKRGKGTPGTIDCMSINNHKQFSTKDRDNDGHSCADTYKGGWWYDTSSTCTYTTPNGVRDSSVSTQHRLSSSTTGSWIYYPSFEMKIRPKSCIFGQIAQMQNAYCNGQ